MHDSTHPNLISFAVTAVVVLVVLALRMRGMRRERPLKAGMLWIVPVIYTALAVAIFIGMPPSPLGWLLCAVALAVGAALGWQRGRMMHLTVDPVTQTVNQRASPAAIIFIVALIAVRAGARSMATSGQLGGLHLSTLLLTDILVSLALGLLVTQRLEMYLRARRLLDEAGGATAR